MAHFILLIMISPFSIRAMREQYTVSTPSARLLAQVAQPTATCN